MCVCVSINDNWLVSNYESKLSMTLLGFNFEITTVVRVRINYAGVFSD